MNKKTETIINEVNTELISIDDIKYSDSTLEKMETDTNVVNPAKSDMNRLYTDTIGKFYCAHGKNFFAYLEDDHIAGLRYYFDLHNDVVESLIVRDYHTGRYKFKSHELIEIKEYKTSQIGLSLEDMPAYLEHHKNLKLKYKQQQKERA
ncbi:hypothetical protein [Bacillus bombysepticus]|uniref:hypothetical protein n=1 Tax=Bacillus bombysepticus TaxID=658666 RepID=UPI0030189364